jgi:hypothetical protein
VATGAGTFAVISRPMQLGDTLSGKSAIDDQDDPDTSTLEE